MSFRLPPLDPAGFRTLIATSLVETWALKLVALVIHGKEEALRQQVGG
jgi:hypothetical protein